MNILTLDILRAACSHRVSVANLMWHWPGGSGLRYDTGQECLTPHSLWEWETVRLCLAPLLLHVMESLWYHFPRWSRDFAEHFEVALKQKPDGGHKFVGRFWWPEREVWDPRGVPSVSIKQSPAPCTATANILYWGEHHRPLPYTGGIGGFLFRLKLQYKPSRWLETKISPCKLKFSDMEARKPWRVSVVCGFTKTQSVVCYVMSPPGPPPPPQLISSSERRRWCHLWTKLALQYHHHLPGGH